MRNIFRFFLSLVTAIVLFGCSDRLDDYYTAEDLAGLKVHIQLPDYSRALVKTRALDTDEKINSVTVIAYKSDGGFISQQPVTMGTDGKITPSLPSGTATVAVVTNVPSNVDLSANLSSTFLDTTPDAKAPICWGSATVNDLLKSTAPTISLLRMTAKTTVQSSTTDFTVEGIKVYYTAGAGSIAPAKDAFSDNGTVSSVTNQSGESFSATSGDYKSASQVFYETPADHAFLIVKGKYKGTEGFYKVKLYDQSVTTSNTELQLLRNHNYIVTIKSVNEAGYSTEAGAVAGEAENRLTVNITDDNPPIVDMIACKDYELGVCAPLTTDGKGGKFNAMAVSSCKKGEGYDCNAVSDAKWVNVGSLTQSKLPSSGDGKLSSTGALVEIPLTVEQNPTENERTATLTVTAGDLTRTITITQAGYDFLADDNRKVQFLINGSLVSIDGDKKSDDYFGTFLPAVQGVSAADNHGLVRDHGLHFAAVKGNTYSYKVPHLEGDQLTNNDASHISIADGGVGNYYTVTLKDNTSDDLWVSSFTITNKAGVTITYPVYHTGVFQNLTSDNQLGTAKTGWFYYGVVEVQGKSGSLYHLLDRNIGATNNGFYSPSTQETMGNEGAKGAYMKLTKTAQQDNKISDGDGITIYCKASSAPYLYVWDSSNAKPNGDFPGKKMSATKTIGGTTYYYQTITNASPINIIFNNGNDKQKTGDIKNITASSAYSYDNNTGYNKLEIIFPDVPNIGDSYMPFSSYFKIPTESYGDDILPKVETRHTKTGEAYYCYVIKTTGASTVQPAEVYIPVTGYYEGTSYRNENHANIWTCTRLSGYQGFNTSSPEFGFWFRYLDCHNSIEEITNMRIVNGSAGRYGSIYNAMPVRGIHKE